uniref:Uncharacterized protein n=1 Tax=Leersia perrieri TaxID=77586 RepID=A0A0D9XGD2_9ORYZ
MVAASPSEGSTASRCSSLASTRRRAPWHLLWPSSVLPSPSLPTSRRGGGAPPCQAWWRMSRTCCRISTMLELVGYGQAWFEAGGPNTSSSIDPWLIIGRWRTLDTLQVSFILVLEKSPPFAWNQCRSRVSIIILDFELLEYAWISNSAIVEALQTSTLSSDDINVNSLSINTLESLIKKTKTNDLFQQ